MNLNRISRTLGLFLGVTFITLTAQAFRPSERPELPNLDRRVEKPARAAAAGANVVQNARANGLANLRRQLPEAQVDLEPITGTARHVSARDGFLTGPGARGRGLPANAPAGLAANDPHLATRAFLREHRGVFGHGPELLDQARVARDYVTPQNGMKTAVWEQLLDDVPVFEAKLISHTTRNGELVSIGSQFLPNPDQAATRGTPDRAAQLAAPGIAARRAVALAAQNVEVDLAEERVTSDAPAAAADAERRQKFKAPGLKGEAEVKLIWLPMDENTLLLCWDVEVMSRARGEMFRVLLDARTGEVLVRRCLTTYLSDATYNVFTNDSPTPFSPGWPTPNTNQPPLAARTLVTLPALDTNASPAGWIPDGGNQTLGNNVDAHTDRNSDNSPDLPRPQGSPFRVFNFPMDTTTQDPTNYSPAAVVQLFYLCNVYHDRLYQLGFTEAAGNFQSNNFGRGGLGNDAVQADVQDGSGTDNANFSTPSDGSPGRMQMYIFTGSNPRRDGDFDAEIVFHEYSHGLSWRLVGGGQALGDTQSDGMGEGWSDFYGMCLLSEATDNVNGNYASGGYASHRLNPTYFQNYYFGIRRYPYTTDLTKNPLTFNDIDPAQINICASGAPYSPVSFLNPCGINAGEVHNSGEVWCVTLWEARANLINKHGWAVGNQLILQLVTDGMKLTPPHPNFLQARDAIIQADQVNTGGANRNELWAAFAKRGMGFSATSPASTTTAGVRESFDMPDALRITPLTDFTATGPIGGPFTPLTATYVLTNISTNLVIWRATVASNWLTVTPASGTLLPGIGTTVTAALTPAANALPLGLYRDVIVFTNEVSMVAQARLANLVSGNLDYFTEEFAGADNDLDFQTFTFTPDASANYYSVCREIATNYLASLASATNLLLGNHVARTLTVTGGMTISLYGQATNVFHLSSDGHLTLNGADTSGSATLANHFSRPRVAALLSHLHPGDGGSVFYGQLSNRVAITFERVPEFGSVNTNSFQIELFFDGRIRLTYLSMGSTRGVTGLSRGKGLPPVFMESDFSAYGPCGLPLFVTIPAGATEGAGTLPGAGSVRIASVLPTNLVVQLTSSIPTEVTVPPNVTIPAGSTNATFDLTVPDDALLDGTQVSVIRASAPGFFQPLAAFSVFDNESATLSLTLPLMTVEGTGSITGIVSISAAPDALIAVSVFSSDLTEILTPSVVFIPAGQTSVPVSFDVVDDTEIDGPQNVLLTAEVANWINGTASVTVADNETLNLSLMLRNPLREGQGTVNTAGTVRLSGTLSSNLVINLVSSDPSELTVPASATIVAGQFSAFFSPTVIDDAEVDGAQLVQVDATAAGFVATSVMTIVQDDETPLPPLNPSPANLSSNVITTSDLSWQAGDASLPTIYDVYLGTNPIPGPAELIGTTTNVTTWPLPTLAPASTYYWQVISRRTVATPGPVWRFTTRGVDHFDWSSITSPQLIGVPFAATITARDEFGIVVSNFTGTVALSGWTGVGTSSKIVVTEVDTDPDVIEFINVTSMAVDVSGWRIAVYDSVWPQPRVVLTLPPGSIAPAGEIFRLNEAGTAPGVYPNFFTGTNIDWIADTTVSVLLLDGSGRVVDFMSAAAAAPISLITNPIAIPASEWLTAPIVAKASDSVTYQRIGNSDNQGSNDWVIAAENIGTINPGLTVPFVGGAAPVLIGPTNSGPFVGGVLNISITALQPANNMYLVATDASGHVGTSTNFDVVVENDLGVAMVARPDPVVAGALLTNTITVNNTGPADATGVVTTNFLPPSVSFVSATTSLGSCVLVGGEVRCTLGTLMGGASATITLITTPGAVGQITNRVTVGRAEADSYAGNNSATSVTTVVMPTINLTIADANVVEGNTGVSNLVFLVSLFPRASNTITVSYSTIGGSALAGVDFLSTNGVVTFLAGETNKFITVRAIGDTENESNETFTVNLSSPVNATIADGLAVGTIVNDDFLATIGLASITLIEENCGTPNGSVDPLETVTVQVALQNRSAGAAVATNLNATLVSISGVFRPSGPQNYGFVPPGAVVIRPFTFTAVNVCGGAVSAIFQLDDGGISLGRVTNIYRLGTNVIFRENFDGVSSGTLPAGWTRSSSGSPPPWDTQNSTRHTLPNAAFAAGPGFTSDNQLTSPAFMVPLAPARLSFFHRYSTQTSADGGNLEISINGGEFTDILTAGGNFVLGGYSGTIQSGTVPAWSGSIAGFSNVIVNLPAAATGGSVALRWRFRTDGSVSSTGWFVDSITADAFLGCCTSSPPLITQITWSAGTVNMRWLSLPGRSYRLQYRAAFDAGIWTEAPGDVLATSTLSQKNDTPGAGPRFYRVVMLP